MTYPTGPSPTRLLVRKEPIVSRRPIWLIDLGDGIWAVSCMACRIALCRGTKAGADRAARSHYCEPVIPLGRRRGGGR
jgi:hypothetical protein